MVHSVYRRRSEIKRKKSIKVTVKECTSVGSWMVILPRVSLLEYSGLVQATRSGLQRTRSPEYETGIRSSRFGRGQSVRGHMGR